VWRAQGLTHPLGDKHRGFSTWYIPRHFAQVDRAAATMTPELLLTLMYAGSAEEICDEVAPLAAAGCTHFILANTGASFTATVREQSGAWLISPAACAAYDPAPQQASVQLLQSSRTLP